MDELTTMPLAAVAGLIRAREVSPVEVVEAQLGRIERINPTLNAIITIAPDAIDCAREAESAIVRGDATGPLHGVPVTIKDTIDTADLRTTCGSRLYERRVPERDAPAVSRVKAAGAIIVGKSNVSEFALDYAADNTVFGRTVNPYDTARTPGGSSGGCAAAVSACLSFAGVGSDLAGSLRIPAGFCGIPALRPTAARIPSAGHHPPVEGAFSLGASLGPMARTLDDLELLFDVLANGRSAWPGPKSIHREETRDIGGWRVAFYDDDGISPVTNEIRSAIHRVAGVLEDAGLHVIDERPPGINDAAALWTELFAYPTAVYLNEIYGERRDLAGPLAAYLIERLESRPAPLLDQFIAAWRKRDRLRARLLEWMAATPLILAPVFSTTAFEHGARSVEVGTVRVPIFRAGSYAQVFNVMDLPAAAVPAGQDPGGMPIGVQIVGMPFAEDSVLAAAAIVERGLGGWKAPQCAN